ncbi:MAG: PQQ-binding-like beta-propeller repeat protein [Acidobacteriota bacterium]
MGQNNQIDVSRRKFMEEVAAGATLAALGPFVSVGRAQSAELPQPGRSDWPRFGYDLHNTRFNSRENQLGKDNVGRLKVKWEFDAGAPSQTTPAVVGDTLYFGTWAGDFFALDSRTGALRWKSRVDEPLPTERRFLRSSPEYADGRLYFGTGKTNVHCLDAATGKEIWRTLMDEDPVANQSQVTCSPVVFRGRVYIGTSSGHARIACLDAATGVVRWSFFTVPNVKNGGGSVWTSPAIDEEHGIVYNATGNAKSFMPPGPMLYTESLIANDIDTGELLWYHQARPGNVPFNLDFGCHPMLFDAVHPSRSHPSRAGAVRRCVGAGNKAGFYTVDRYTGERYWKVMLTNHSDDGGPIMSSTAVAYNRVFVVSDAIQVGSPRPSSSVTAGLNAYTGDIEWWVHNPAITHAPVAVANGVFYQGLMDGMLSGLDTDTGDKLWEYRLPSGNRSGIAIANGALFASNGGPFPSSRQPKYSMYCFTVDGQ